MSNYEPGYNLRAKITGIGRRYTRIAREELDFQKEFGYWVQRPNICHRGQRIMEVPAGRIEPGAVIHTTGWPLGVEHYGGGLLYAMPEGFVSLGLVSALIIMM